MARDRIQPERPVVLPFDRQAAERLIMQGYADGFEAGRAYQRKRTPWRLLWAKLRAMIGRAT